MDENKDNFDSDEETDMSVYKKYAPSVFNFVLVYNKDNFEDKSLISFKPEMAHQIFGESESIFGYKSLSINLYYLHNSSKCYLDIKSSGKIKNKLYQADNILQSLNPWLPENFTINREMFKDMINSEQHDMIFGTVLNTFNDQAPCKLFLDRKVYAKYKVTQCDLKNLTFKECHSRFETFIIWFIDAANFIDLDDERWMIFYVYEEFEHPDTKYLYVTPVGFCTVYKFYAYPNNVRARISQFFVLPSHQKRGIGTHLYKTILKTMREIPEVLDITVEEPVAAFQKIRDCVDCLLIYEELQKAKLNLLIHSKDQIMKFIYKHKICKRQCQKVYDILGCFESSKQSSEQYKEYLNNIKTRIRNKAEKEVHGNKRICNLKGIATTVMEPIGGMVEAEYKQYMEEINPSLKSFQQKMSAY